MLKGKITIGRYQNSKGPDRCYLRVEDVLSGTQFLELELTPEQFGYAVTGLGAVNCEFDLILPDRVGKKREMKQEVVSIHPLTYKESVHTALREASKPLWVDGWMPMINEGSRIEPFQRNDKEWSYNVTFVRWVDVEESGVSS